MDNQVESANAEERSLFHRIKKAISFCTFFLFLGQLLIKLRNLGCILFPLTVSLMGLLVSPQKFLWKCNFTVNTEKHNISQILIA